MRVLADHLFFLCVGDCGGHLRSLSRVAIARSAGNHSVRLGCDDAVRSAEPLLHDGRPAAVDRHPNVDGRIWLRCILCRYVRGLFSSQNRVFKMLAICLQPSSCSSGEASTPKALMLALIWWAR